MRLATGLILAGAVSLLAASAAWSQALPAPNAPAAAPQAAPAPAPPPAPVSTRPPCNNPDALGIGRTVEIDTTGGPGIKLVCAIEGDNRIGREADIEDMQRWIRESKGESNA